MADTKASLFTALTGAGTDSAADLIPIVDVSAGPSGNKVITPAQLATVMLAENTVSDLQAAFDAGSGATRNFNLAGADVGGLTFTAAENMTLNITGLPGATIGDITITLGGFTVAVNITGLAGGAIGQFIVDTDSGTLNVSIMGLAGGTCGGFAVTGHGSGDILSIFSDLGTDLGGVVYTGDAGADGDPPEAGSGLNLGLLNVWMSGAITSTGGAGGDATGTDQNGATGGQAILSRLDCRLSGTITLTAGAGGAGNGAGSGGASGTTATYAGDAVFDDVTVDTLNGMSFAAGTGTLAVADGKTATVNNTLTFTGTDGITVAFGAGLSVAAGKTFTLSNTLTFTGTDASSVAFGAGGTVFYTGTNLGSSQLGAHTWTGEQLGPNGSTSACSWAVRAANNGLFSIAGNTCSLAANGGEVVRVESTVLNVYQNLSLLDKNMVFGTTTGTKFGTGATQKMGWWNATPVVQPTAVADASGGAVNDAEARTALNALLARLRTLGILAT